MKAARYYGYKDIRIEDIPVPAIPKGYVQVRVAWAGICGTDRHEYTGPIWIPIEKLDKKHQLLLGMNFQV